ncbi:MAG: primosomal protein N' [Acidiferrobacterales bacterium]
MAVARAPILRVAVPAPLRRCFDYVCPSLTWQPSPGVRVRVPFGQRELVGVLVGVADDSTVSAARLKPILKVLDPEPLLPAKLLELLQWAADYYHHPLGDVLTTALPACLRQGRDAQTVRPLVWSLTAAGREAWQQGLRHAPLQQRLLAVLAASAGGVTAETLVAVSDCWRAALRRMVDKGWVAVRERDCVSTTQTGRRALPLLTASQSAAVAAVADTLGAYQAFLLQGVTGSGKTEVYLKLIEQVLALERQALVLVPEIGLTPQLLGRVRARFDVPVAVLHSGLSDHERLAAWMMAREGRAPIVLGARSAVFVPLNRPGVIIVDEEHDSAYKQQEGFRYHARDIAVMRAHREDIPIVLGSATPSLDSLKNVAEGNYRPLRLPSRIGTAGLPDVRLLDLRQLPANDGLSPPLLEQINQRLQRGEQSLLFLNRRGFAPAYMCHDCGWFAPCPRCDARLTFHRRRAQLRCHHCGRESPQPAACPVCHGAALHALGEGTERVEAALARLFPSARIVRIDRDSTRRKGELEEQLRRVDVGEADIMVGTQMLSKGHDFPNVTLVGVLNADQRLYSVDFRASEQLVQQILQVSGRAGRGEKPGTVWIQTYHPDHPIFAALRTHDYDAFAAFALDERRATRHPPFSHVALLRAESQKAGAALSFVATAHRLARACLEEADIELMDPVPAPMERRAGRYRAQLLVHSLRRRPLHPFLSRWLRELDEAPTSRRVRWSLDVDPVDMY